MTAANVERASRKMLYLRDAYMKAFPNEQPPIDPNLISTWAHNAGLWKPIEVSPVEVLRRKLCRAFRHEYITDPQGRQVSANFAKVVEVATPDGLKHVSKVLPNLRSASRHSKTTHGVRSTTGASDY